MLQTLLKTSTRIQGHRAARLPSKVTWISTQTSTLSNDVQQHQNLQSRLDPKGDLFQSDIGPELVGKSASIVRVFGPQSSSQALLSTGGPNLARYSSFDPTFDRAKEWIRSHAVGPAVGSHLLASGLFCGLVEASFPNSIPMSSTVNQRGPIFVGTELLATVTVEKVEPTDGSFHTDKDNSMNKKGFEVQLKTELKRIRDDEIVVDGKYTVWLPDYMHM